MTVEPKPPPRAPRERKPVARLAEALASAQAIARDDELEREAAGSSRATVDAPAPATASVDPEATSLFARVRALPGDDPVEPEADVDAGHRDRFDATAGAGDGDDLAARASVPAVSVPTERDRPGRTASLRPLYLFMVLLVVAVPVLGYIGYRSVGDSTRGQVLSGRSKPDAPGYEALVEPTPVALLMQVDSAGSPVTITLLSLSGPDQKGGAVVSIPVSTRLKKPVLEAYTYGEAIRRTSASTAGAGIAAQLGLGFTESIKLDDAKLASFLEPAGVIEVDNPVAVESPKGEQFAKGKLELSPEQVPQYLAANDSEGSEITRLQRAQLVWTAWIAKIRAAKGSARIVPGETGAGLGRYLRGLAAGQVSTASLPVVPAAALDGHETLALDTALARLMLTNAVPYPIAGSSKDRVPTKVLNGTGPGAIPPSITQRLTYSGAQISVVGNAPHFGVARTTITYSDVSSRPIVLSIAALLGNVKVVHAPSGEDTADITIVIGKDLVTNPPGALVPSEIGS
jgi:hypothetical protein